MKKVQSHYTPKTAHLCFNFFSDGQTAAKERILLIQRNGEPTPANTSSPLFHW